MSESSPAPGEGKTILLPSVEIAKIAAALRRGPTLERKAAIEEAIVLYLEAAIRCEQLDLLPFHQIVAELNDPWLLDCLREHINRPKKLRLYPDAKLDPKIKIQSQLDRSDEVRVYLAERVPNLNWKKSRTVREAIKLLHLDRARIHNEENAKAIRSLERKHKKMAKERGLNLDLFLNGMDIPDQQRRFDGPTMFKQFMEGRAVWDESGRVLYWEIEQTFLDRLIRWRLDLKKRGGIKVVAKAAKKYWARR